MTMTPSVTRNSSASGDTQSEANREHLSECCSPLCQNGKRRASEVLDFIGAGEGNRTLVFSLEGCCSPIDLPPRAADQLSRPARRLNHSSGGETLNRPQLPTYIGP